MPVTPLAGRLFGPELPPAGVPVGATLDVVQLSLLLPDGGLLSIGLAQLAVRGAGFEGRHLELAWGSGSRRWALLVDDPQAVEAIRRNAPAALQTAIEQFGRQNRKSSAGRRLGLSALVLVIALPLLAILLVVLAARPLAGWISGFIPIEQEARLGDRVFALQAAKLDLVRDTEANRAIEIIGQRLAQGSRYSYRWNIVRDPSLNAFAVPGGIVVIHSGLILAAGDADELAGVIAHEIEHIELRHSLQALMQQAGLRLAIAAVVGDFGIAAEAAGFLSGLSFSRDSEREADLQGLRRMQATGIDPEGMVRMFARLDTQTAGVAPPAWLASHPTTPERLQDLRKSLSAVTAPAAAKSPLAGIDWPAVQTSLRE